MSRHEARGARGREPRDADDIVGDSPQMRRIRDRISRVAPTGSTVLITGDLGVGKEQVARAIHRGSARAALPFVAVSGGAVPEAILDPESRGGERPDVGGAARGRPGRVEMVDTGTLFLTHVGETGPAAQLALLRFLEERRFRRTGDGAGGRDGKAAAVRVVAATNRNLARMVEDGDFRRDLFYRLNVFTLHVPPLHARRLDILPLARHFAERFAREMGRDLRGFAPAAERALETHPWPGNVRELESVVERAVVLEASNRVRVESLELGDGPGPDRRSGSEPRGGAGAVHYPSEAPADPNEAPADRFPESGFVLERHVRNLEREYLAQALQQAGGVKVRAAGLLGMSFRSFRYYAKKYDLG